MLKAKNMKKKHLIHLTSSLRVGGAETVLCDLVQGLQDEFEQAVIFIHDGPKRQVLEALGVPTYQLKGWFSVYDPGLLINLYVLLKKLRPDVVHSLLWLANVSSRMVCAVLGIPLVSAYHNNLDQDGWVRNVCDRITMHFSNQLVAVSPEVAESIHKFIPSVRVPITVIKNGIDAQGVLRAAQQAGITRAMLGLSQEQYVIGSVGRFEPVKNYTLLLEAFALVYAKLPQARLVLVGQGSQEQALRDKAQGLGVADKVIFVVGKSAYGYYPLFDCFVQSSDKEGVSMALLEAQSCGVPCVATNVDSQHAVLSHGISGMVVPAGNASALSMAIEQVVTNKELKNSLVHQATITLTTGFTRQVMIDNYRALIENVAR